MSSAGWWPTGECDTGSQADSGILRKQEIVRGAVDCACRSGFVDDLRAGDPVTGRFGSHQNAQSALRLQRQSVLRVPLQNAQVSARVPRSFWFHPGLPRFLFQQFFAWYNTAHHHSAIGWLTPQVVHYGKAAEVSAARQKVLDQAFPDRMRNASFAKMPESPRLPDEVWINPPEPRSQSD